MAKATKTFNPKRTAPVRTKPMVPKVPTPGPFKNVPARTAKPVTPVVPAKTPAQPFKAPAQGRPASPGKSAEALFNAPGQQGKLPPGTKKRGS